MARQITKPVKRPIISSNTANMYAKFDSNQEISVTVLRFNPKICPSNKTGKYPFETCKLYYNAGYNNLTTIDNAECYISEENTFISDIYAYNTKYIYLHKDSKIYEEYKKLFDKYFYKNDNVIRIEIGKNDFEIEKKTINIYKNSSATLPLKERNNSITTEIAVQDIKEIMKTDKPFIIVGNRIMINNNKTKVTENYITKK